MGSHLIKKSRVIVAISGGSGSGKTTIASLLQKKYDENSTLVSQDSYYRDLSHIIEEARNTTNFDHPDSIDFDLLQNNIKSLKYGQSVSGPVYSFKTHSREDTKNIPLSETCNNLRRLIFIP